MGIQNKTDSTIINMKAFVAVSALLAAAAADQTHHQVIKHGNAPAVSHSVHKPHGSYAAVVASQPHAAPQDVHNPYAGEKYSAAVHAPAHVPVHAPAYHHPAPAYHKPAPVYHKPAPVVHKPAPYHAPVIAHPVKVAHPAPAPYHPAPVVHKPAPYHPAPAYKEPSYDGPAVYQYGYAVADDYSGANFAQNENRDGYATTGEYRVALPDGRTQIVTYSVADGYSGYVADVKYEGEAHYEPYHPAPVKAHPAPAYHA